MQSVIDSFNERVGEIDLFFALLDSLNKPDVQLYFPNQIPRHRFKNFEPDLLKTLKATAFLLIYNLVESTVRDAIGAVYERAVQDGCTMATLKDDVRKVWINQRFRKIEYGGSTNSFREVGHELVELTLNRTLTDLDKDLLPVSGNLDAKKIRELCDKHGMTFSKTKTAHMGDKLVTIKNKRNSLAHGDESFAECGRQHTVDELKEMKKQAVSYLRSVVKNIRAFADNGRYKD